MARVAHVIPWPIVRDGLTHFVAEMCHATSQFADVAVIAKQAESVSPDFIRGADVMLVRSEHEAAALLQKLNPDIVHHHGPNTGWAFAGIDFDRGNVVGTHHAYGSNRSNTHPWVIPICGPAPGVIRHGVNLDLFRPGARAWNGPVLGFVGRIHPSKLPETFLNELEKRQDIRLRIAGEAFPDGLSQKIYQRLRRMPNVEMLGYVEREKLPQFYHEISVFVMPSCTESACLSVIEAMACGLPIVATDCDGLRETLEGLGLLTANAPDVFSIAAALLDDPLRRAKLSVEGRARAEREFDLSRMVRAYHEVYRQRSGGAFQEVA